MPITPLNQLMPPPPPGPRPQGAPAHARETGEIDFSVINRPLELLYRSAIEKLNEYLEPELGEDAISQAAESGMDFSPEAVAERIVAFASAGFVSYSERHADQPRQDQLDGFLELVGGAIQKGFEEAKEILEGLEVFEGEIADNANRTYDLIQEKLAAFADQIQANFAGPIET
jgi:hypothetical protein